MASRLLQSQKKKALQELKKLIQEALNSYQLTSVEGEVPLMWGIPLVGDERTDRVILKFLRARGFEVLDAFEMIKKTLRWRNEAGVESLLDEDFGNDYKKALFTHGQDKDGYPVWYIVLEECLNNSMCQSMSSDIEKQQNFLNLLIQFVEKNIRTLDLRSPNTSSFVLVIDLKNTPWFDHRDLYKIFDNFLQVLRDYYPDFVAKQLWINAPWWYRTYYRMYLLVFEEWGMNKFAYSGSTKTIETLFRYISPGLVPVKYGGFGTDDKQKCGRFRAADPVSEITIKPATKHNVEFTIEEACDVSWELRVIGWDVGYEAKFVPSGRGKYMTHISNLRKLAPSYESVISESFRVTDTGKLVLTIHNVSSKKKKLLSRIRAMAYELGEAPSLRGWL